MTLCFKTIDTVTVIMMKMKMRRSAHFYSNVLSCYCTALYAYLMHLINFFLSSVSGTSRHPLWDELRHHELR
jgi:hypothetical protein